MSLRFCERCEGEVEDVGGYCLLGHPLRLEPLIPSLAHIRAEVDRAFDEVRLEAPDDDIEVLQPEEPPAPAFAVPPPPPPPGLARRQTVWQSLDEDPSGAAGDPISAFAPPPRMDWGPERARFPVPSLRRREGPAPA
ncbi:MAG: hypothetical protein ABR529_01035 [Actinomycetota bacterium]